MFINCPHCNALVATDPATDLPPPRCPRCAVALREEAAPPNPDAADAAPAQATDATPANTPLVEAVAAATAPTPAAGGDTTDALARTPVPLAPDVVAGTSAPTPPVDEPETSPEGNGLGDEHLAPDDASGIEPGDGAAGATRRAETGDVTAIDPEPSTTEALAGAGPAAATDVPDPATTGTPVEPATPTPSSVEDAGKPEPEAETGSVPDAGDEATTARAAGEPDTDVEPDPRPAPDPVPATGPAPASASDQVAPNFARARAPVAASNGKRRWVLPSVIAGLSLLLALQWVLADRARLAADARWRPFVAQLCGVLRCRLPPWREPDAFALLDRDVRPHPSIPGALRVSATFRNDARWAQPWPDVVLTLSDVDGRAVGARAFAAGEYLGAMPTQNELASGQTATIRMDVLEPAPRIVAFAFDFR
jgi:hypothetical protein